MYSFTSTDHEQSLFTKKDVDRDDESVDFASLHSDILGGLREKAERLERARRLLDGATRRRERSRVKGDGS
jgi:hypothetical protein